MADRINLSLDEDAQATMNQIEDDIENIYGGKSQFFRDMLMDYDEKATYKAKIQLLEEKIQSHYDKAEELELQLQGLKQKVEEIEANEDDEEQDVEVHDSEFWDKTVRKIFKRTDKDEPDSVSKRYNKWFNPRHRLYTNKYKELTVERFKQRLIDEANDRGLDTEVIK